jgi:hypothetical protein
VNNDTKRRRSRTRIPVYPETRDLVRAQKRGGESYDELLRAMVAQYEPKEVAIED